MNTYTWFIYSMDVIKDFEGLSDFVTRIRWRYDAISDDGYKSDIEGSTIFNIANPNDYHQYVDLTKEEVIGWIENNEDVYQLQTKLDQIIEEKRNPPIVNLPFPWD